VDSVLDRLPLESRVAIVRLRSLGDCVLTTPAAAILKRARPDLRVAMAVEHRFRAVFEDNPDVDEILPASPVPLRKWRPRLCLNFHGGTRSACMTALSGAPFRAGFGHYRYGFVYNVRLPRAQEVLGVERKVHTAEHLASAIFALGAPRCEIPGAMLAPRPFPWRAFTLRAGRVDSFAVLHPVAATPEKTWHAAGFLEVAKYLQDSGVEPVFIGGPGDDLSPFSAYRTMLGAPLFEIKQLLSAASLFIGNDSGPAHMAAAFGLPCVVIFGASDPEIWGPWRTASEVLHAPATAQVLEAVARIRVAV
jgi:heptosyltransferase III